jgi:hypothetical protein
MDSLIETAKLNGLDSEAHLRDMIAHRRSPDQSGSPAFRLELAAAAPAAQAA